MEDLLLSIKELRILRRFQSRFEKRYNVKIILPECSDSFLKSDIMFATILGKEGSIKQVKEKMEHYLNKRDDKPILINERKEVSHSNISVITLSDSETEVCENCADGKNSSVECENSSNMEIPLDESVCIIDENCNSITNMRSCDKSESSSNVEKPFDESVCIIDENCNSATNIKSYYESETSSNVVNPLDESVCIIDENCCNTTNIVKISADESPCIIAEIPSKMKTQTNISNLVYCGLVTELNLKKRKQIEMQSKGREKKRILIENYGSVSGENQVCEVSTTNILDGKQNKTSMSRINETEKRQPLPDFIPVSYSKFVKKKIEPDICSNNFKMKESSAIEKIEKPLKNRVLRPIVIDGSNIAMEHGKSSGTFSIKGIKIAIDFFLERGHTQITAFVPLYRRHRDKGNFPTTDLMLLEDLAKQQYVVFTPSRKVEELRFSSYDDRFIVKLAATNGGVILSNDNYRDIMEESESFKKTIKERLLLYCFVGDMLMVAEDPVGRNGPTLDEYLSFNPGEELLYLSKK